MSASHDAAGEHGEHHVHVTPLKHYFGVFAALLFLTFVTVWIAQFDFGSANTFIAMFVATIKASLVALVFMHLLYDERLNSLTFVFGLLFVALFFIFTLTDVLTRAHIDPKQDNLSQQQETLRALEVQAEQADNLAQRYPKRTLGEDYPAAPDERVSPPVPAAPATAAEVPPAEGAPAEGAPAEGAPAEGAPAEGAPAEGAPPAAAASAAAAPAVAAFAVDAAKAAKGKELFTSKTCSACHSIDGSRLVGPSLKGFWGRKPELEGGAEAVGDAAYFTESIRTPNAKVNKGYPPAMPAGLPVSDEEIDLLLHYVNSL